MTDTVYISSKIFQAPADRKTGGEFIDGGILVAGDDGKIRRIFESREEVNSWMYKYEAAFVVDYGDKIIMPGLIDVHVNANEPGRKDWEGFETLTKAAAHGGITTIAEMGVFNLPPVTTLFSLKNKINTARNKVWVDTCFWGGIVPGNENDLLPLLDYGVVGFKCYLCGSGVAEFPPVNETQLEKALALLDGRGTVVMCHAELEKYESEADEDDSPKSYQTYLATRPEKMETEAAELLIKLAGKYNVHIHIANVSSAKAVAIYRKASPINRITIETCPHYLTLNSSDIPDAKTEFKTTPPIRDADNQLRLLEALKTQQIDIVTSAHSSTLPGIKCTTYGKTRGDFLCAWSGIAAIQYTLPVMWTHCTLQQGLTVTDLVRLLCEAPAELYGISREKSRIAEGYDADFCVWDPAEEFIVHKDSIQHQIKSSPYVDRRLKGVVHATVLRGCLIYEKDTGIGPKEGRLILKRDNAKKKVRAIKFKDELEEHDD